MENFTRIFPGIGSNTGHEIIISSLANGFLVSFPDNKGDSDSFGPALKGIHDIAKNLNKDRNDLSEIVKAENIEMPEAPEDMITVKENLFVFKTFNEVIEFLVECNKNSWKYL